MKKYWITYLLFIPAVLIGVLGIAVFFIKESFLIGYKYYA